MGDRQDRLEAVIDEMLLEDPQAGYETLAKWCAKYPAHRDELTRFAATLAVQKAMPEGPRIDEARVIGRLMDHASGVMRRQDAARPIRKA